MDSDDKPVHYWLCTAEGRPFLSRILCDASAQRRRRGAGRTSPSWNVVTCTRCLELGSEAAEAIVNLPDAALIALGAWHEGMSADGPGRADVDQSSTPEISPTPDEGGPRA